MVSIRRVVDRSFALGLAATPAYPTLADVVDSQAALAGTLGSLVLLAVLLVEYGPNHTSAEADRFGFATLVTYAAVWLAVDYGLGYRFDAHPAVALVVWLAALGAAFAHVYRRRQRSPTPAQDTSRR